MTKEKTARLIPNAIQVCTDTEKVKNRDFQRCKKRFKNLIVKA